MFVAIFVAQNKSYINCKTRIDKSKRIYIEIENWMYFIKSCNLFNKSVSYYPENDIVYFWKTLEIAFLIQLVFFMRINWLNYSLFVIKSNEYSLKTFKQFVRLKADVKHYLNPFFGCFAGKGVIRLNFLQKNYTFKCFDLPRLS